MIRKFVPAVLKYKSHLDTIRFSRFSSILDHGYFIQESAIGNEFCDKLEEATIEMYANITTTYNQSLLESIAEVGCVRSPFTESMLYRDLLMHDIMHEACKIFFPCDYILHLNRSIVTNWSGSSNVSPSEIHRDIPYLYTPTYTPVSLSFLFFFSHSENSQLAIVPYSHQSDFYNLSGDLTPIKTTKGSLLIFDSNLLHCSLPTDHSCTYSLFMFSSPIIKPVVSYTSKSVSKIINKHPYRLGDVHKCIGSYYYPPGDDTELIQRKIQRTKKDERHYIPVVTYKEEG